MAPHLEAAWSMVGCTLLLATMSVGVKFASSHYGAGEIAFYRGILGSAMTAALARHQGIALRTPLVWAQFWRSATGAVAMTCFFYALGRLSLGTAVTLNYTSSVWIALFVIAASLLKRTARHLVEPWLIVAVVFGFVGVALVLRPTIEQDHVVVGLIGLVAGMLSGLAHLQVGALGRAGEPELRTVFYFSVGNVAAGAAAMLLEGVSPHDDLPAAGALVAIALLSTLAQVLLTRAYSIGKPLVNASLQYLVIAWAYVYGVVVFGERLGASALLGIAIIVAAGVGATALRARRRA